MKKITILILILYYINSFSQNIKKKDNGNYAFFNLWGEQVSNEFNDFSIRKDINAVVVKYKRDLVALHENNGDIIVPRGRYNYFGRLHEKFDLIEVNKIGIAQAGGKGYINRKGKEIIPPIHFYSYVSNDGFVYLSKRQGTKEGVMDILGNIIIPFEYLDIFHLKNGFFRVIKYNNGKHVYGFFNSKGKQVIPFKYADATAFSDKGFAHVTEQFLGKRFVINTKGEIVSILKYPVKRMTFSEGLVPALDSSKYGYINHKNEIIIGFKYDEAESFRNGLARVSINGKFGFINTKGGVVIPIKFDIAPYYFTQKVERFKSNKKEYFFDKTGKEIKNKIDE